MNCAGKSANGGFRLGDMEMASLAGHGATEVIMDRACVASDGKAAPTMPVPNAVKDGAPGQIWICQNCGMRADSARTPGGYCTVCSSSSGVKSVAGVQVWEGSGMPGFC